MYAVYLVMDDTLLEEGAYEEIDSYLFNRGFDVEESGRLYLQRRREINAVVCVEVVRGLSKAFDWFSPCVKKISMHRIEETCDLMDTVNDVPPPETVVEMSLDGLSVTRFHDI